MFRRDPISPFPLVTLPSMSRVPRAPLYLGCARSARPLPCGFTGHVAHPIRSVETRSLPPLTRSYPRHFTFYVAHPIRSIPVIPINPTPPGLQK